MMPNRDFYVYVLFDWLGVPRYVGKGKGGRMYIHERESDPRNWMKNEFIELTVQMLDEVPKLKVREKLLENEAFETEIALIAAIGRFPAGPLVNMTDGGEGGGGAIRSENFKRHLSQRQRKAWSRKTPEERRQITAAGVKAARLVITPEQRRENGRKGGRKGGLARVAKMTPEELATRVREMAKLSFEKTTRVYPFTTSAASGILSLERKGRSQ